MEKWRQFKGVFAGCLATVIIFSFLFQDIDAKKFLPILLNVNFQLFLVTVGWSLFINIIVGVYMSQGILRMLGLNLPFREVLLLRVGSSPVGAAFPFKIGEISRPAYLNRIHDLPYNKGITYLILDWGGKTIALFLILYIGILLYPLKLNFFEAMTALSAALIVLVMTVLFFCRKKTLGDERVYSKENVKNKIEKAIYDFISNFQKLSPEEAFFILGFSSIKIFGELLSFFLLAEALGLSIPPQAMFYFFPMINIIARLPVGIQGLGPREAAVVVFFIGFAEKIKLLNWGILYSLVEYVLPLLPGFVLLPLFLKKYLTLSSKHNFLDRYSPLSE